MSNGARAVPGHLQSFLAFDFGLKRTGFATGVRLLGKAQPRGVLRATGAARWPLVDAQLREWQPDALVVGVPFHPDGAAHDNTRRAQQFARQLRGRTQLPVFEVDERYTTTEALAQGARADAVDAAAAALILDQFFNELP